MLSERVLLDDVRDVVFHVDAEGRWLFLSLAWTALLGWTREQSIGRVCVDFVHADDRAASRERFGALIAGADDCLHEARYAHQDGSWRWMEAHARATRDATGRVTGATGTLRDVTERAEAAHLADERALRSGVIQALLTLALESTTLDQFLQRSLETILSAPVLGMRRQGGIFLATGEPPVLELRANHGLPARVLETCRHVPAGTCLCGRVALSRELLVTSNVDARHENCAHAEPHGHCVAPILSGKHLHGVLVLYVDPEQPDDDARRAFVQALADTLALAVDRRRSESDLQSLVASSPDAMGVYRGGRFVFANEAVARLLGYERAEQLLGTRVLDVIHPLDRDCARERVEAVWATGRPSTARELRFLRKDGSEVAAEVLELRIVFGGQPAILSLARDVTERRKLAAHMMGLDRMVAVGTLATGVAHEINNPLAYVLANVCFATEELEVLASDERFADTQLGEVRAALADARQGAERVQKIVQDLRMLAHQDTAVVGTSSLASVLQVAASVAGSEVRHRARLVLDCEQLPRVVGTEGKLAQVFLNLLVNAAQAIPEGAPGDNEILVTGRIEGDFVHVEVRDTGAGIPPENLPRLFDPFFTTKPVGQGTGLGLAICRGIVRSLGGDLSVSSVLGNGSTFVVLLPRAESPSEKSPPSSSPAPQVKARVLVVDDEVLVRVALRRTLQARHEVVLAADAAEALGRLQAGERFDVILCDLMMPGMTGMELFARVAALWPDHAGRFVFMTS